MIKKYKDGERYKHQGKSYTWHDGADNLIPDDDPESTYKKHERSNELRRDTPPYKSYSEKLKDPRWQKKRLEILSRDNFECKSCRNGEKTLHVHHLRYEKGSEPWEAEADDLVTLCEDCHEAMHYIQSHPTLGIETFSCVMQLYDRLEGDAIEKYLTECDKDRAGVKPRGKF